MARKSKARPSLPGPSTTTATGSSGELERLERILELMDRHEVAELEWEKGGERLSLRTKSAFSGAGHSAHSFAGAQFGRDTSLVSDNRVTELAARSVGTAPSGHAASHSGQSGHSGHPAASAAAPAPAKAPEIASNQKQVVSPFVGTFYRAATPAADPYVREGQAVKRGDVLCIIEAMKLMNEIEADFPGKIVSCLVENGQPVEFGEPLFLVDV